MLRKKFLAVPALAAAIAVGAAAVPAGATGSSSSGKTIADVVIAKSSTNGFDHRSWDYDILLKAVVTADLAGVLSDPAQNLTVFAPDDAAFVRTARTLGYTGWSEQGAWDFLVGALTNIGGGDPIPVLTNILLYHVVPGRLGPIQVLLSGSLNTALEGASFKVKFLQLVDNDPQIPNPYLNVFALNQKASNGVIHGITRVLIPVDLP